MPSRKDALQGLVALALGAIFGCQPEALRPQPVIPVIPLKANTPTAAPVAAASTPSSPPVVKTGAPPPNPQPVVKTGTIPAPLAAEGGSEQSSIQLTSAETSPVATEDRLRELYRQASARYAKMNSYIARFRRQEQVNGKERPEELVVFKFRKQPYSVYMKWIGTEGKGREVVYVKGRYDDKINTLLAAGDVPLMPAGKRFSIPVDSPLVQSNSRYPLTEAGIGALIERFGQQVAKSRSFLEYKGNVKRPEFVCPVEEVVQKIPPGGEPLLPQGGLRRWYFDTATHLPLLVITWDASQHQVEYYCYDQLLSPVDLDDEDFDPANLGKANR